MFYHSPIFETHVNICSASISNNCSFRSAVHHSGFTKTIFCRNFSVLIGNITFFKCTIRFMFHHRSIFKTDINIFISTISNNSRFHSAVHYPGFTKTIFCRSFNVCIGNFTSFKRSIHFMFCHSSIFKTDIYIVASTISNNSSFHSTIHHSCFSKTVFSRSFNVLVGNFTFFKCSIRFIFCYSPIFETHVNV